MPDYALQTGQTVLDVLVEGGLVPSRGEGKRMLEQRAVRLDGETLQEARRCFSPPGCRTGRQAALLARASLKLIG